MKLENKGFTLVEMLVACLISLIVISSVGHFMNVGTKGYHSTDRDVMLQMEAQTVVNQISDMITEANNAFFDTSNKTLTLYYNLGQLEGGKVITKSDAKRKMIWFCKNLNRLYFYNINSATDYTSAMGEITKTITSDRDVAIGQLLGEYVEDFSSTETSTNGVGTGNNKEGDKSVDFSLAFKNETKEYKTTNEITLRNRIVNISER